MPYLLKSEPTTYSFDDLERDGKTTWDGISNPQALLNLRSMKPGEKLVIYHSGTGKAAIGTAKVLSVDPPTPKTPRSSSRPSSDSRRKRLSPRCATPPSSKTPSSSASSASR